MPDAHVFGNECGEKLTSIRTAWELTCHRAGIQGLHFHDLRREFASRLPESSADLHDVQLFLGHAAITTTEPLCAEHTASARAGIGETGTVRRIRTRFAQTSAREALGGTKTDRTRIARPCATTKV